MFDRLCSETTMKGVLPAVGPHHLHQLLATTGPVQVGVVVAACLQ
jgi:conserved oligomeric Golgi complex subunit 5